MYPSNIIVVTYILIKGVHVKHLVVVLFDLRCNVDIITVR